MRVYRDVARASATVRLYGPDGVAVPAFTNPKRGGVPASVGARIQLTLTSLSVRDLPSAKAVVKQYKRKHGTRSVDPNAIYGYEAMALALDALARAGDNAGDRAEVLKALFATKDRDSVLGRYSIDPNGDTTLKDYGVYVITRGRLTYSKKIVAG